MKKYCILILLISACMNAQAQWSVSAGYKDLYNQDFWTHGASVQLEYVLPVDLGRTNIIVEGMYTVFFKSGYLPNWPTPAVFGYHQEFSVSPYRFADVLAKAEYRFSEKASHAIASVGIGANYHTAHPVCVRSWIEGIQPRPSFRDVNSSEHEYEPVYQLAFGYHLALTSHLALRPELCYYRNVLNKIDRLPLSVNIRYEF